MVRLTALSSASFLSKPINHLVSAKDRFIVLSSDRSGSLAPYRLDLRNGNLLQLAETTSLDAKSLCLDESEKSLLFLDGGTLKQLNLGSKRTQTLTDAAHEFVAGSTTDDILVLRNHSVERLDGRRIATEAQHLHLVQSDTHGFVFSRALDNNESELFFATADGASCKSLARGKISFPYWSVTGTSVLFLRESVSNGMRIAEIVEVDLQSLQEVSVSGAGQLACFAPNRNCSVFIGAAQSKAQPIVTLLLRSPRREITVCEHHSTNAAAVTPVFAPDSRRIYFESDREGKNAVYSVNVELLVEPT